MMPKNLTPEYVQKSCIAISDALHRLTGIMPTDAQMLQDESNMYRARLGDKPVFVAVDTRSHRVFNSRSFAFCELSICRRFDKHDERAAYIAVTNATGDKVYLIDLCNLSAYAPQIVEDDTGYKVYMFNMKNL